MPTQPRNQLRRKSRRGAIVSMELVLVLPILLGLLLAVIEMALVWSASQRVAIAAQQGCRVATLPGSDRNAVRRAIEQSLHRTALVEQYRFDVQGGELSGDDVHVVVRVPMQAASPDLLRPLGFSLKDREFVAHSTMRKE